MNLKSQVWGAGPRQPPKQHRDNLDVEIQETIHASKGGGESNDSKRSGSTSDAESANIPEQAQDQSASLTNPSPVTAVDSIPNSQTKRESAGGSEYGVGEQASIDISGTLKQCLGSEPVQDYATQRSILREMFHPDLPKVNHTVNQAEYTCLDVRGSTLRSHDNPFQQRITSICLRRCRQLELSSHFDFPYSDNLCDECIPS